jgi:hypothetical protein
MIVMKDHFMLDRSDSGVGYFSFDFAWKKHWMTVMWILYAG